MIAVLKRLWKYGIGTIPKHELQHLAGEQRLPEGVSTSSGCETCTSESTTDASSVGYDGVRVIEEQLPKRIRQLFGRSLHIRHLDSGSCNGCEFELAALMNPVYDIQRFGIDFVASPRHADMLLVTGGVTRNLEEAVRKAYAATPNPKLLVAIGECACGGGIIGDTYANFGGLDKLFPVSVYVPGCPPRPTAILEGILTALDRAHELKSP